MKVLVAIVYASLASLASSEACKPDILIDDFSNIRHGRFEGKAEIINLLGGDYGTDGPNTSLTFLAKSESYLGYVAVRPTRLQVGPIHNYFFIKQNAEACFNLTGYTGLYFEMSVIDRKPAPGKVYDSSFTLTQKSSDCSKIIDGYLPLSLINKIGAESQYHPISKYGSITPNVIRNYTLPFTDFSTRSRDSSEKYDFAHFKDFTFNAFTVVNVEYRFYKFILVGNCHHEKETQNTRTTRTFNGSTNSMSSTATTPLNTETNSGMILSLSKVALVFASVLMLATN